MMFPWLTQKVLCSASLIRITIDMTELKVFHRFYYLRYTSTSGVKIFKEVDDSLEKMIL